MKVVTPEIVWHGKQPVFSADFHKRGENWRMATGGADNDVRVWRLTREKEGEVKVQFASNLSRHSKAVNVVRFSPNGEMLASAGDDEVICLWKLSLSQEDTGGGNLIGEEFLTNKENWTVSKMLRGHIGDIYDICWSSDSKYLISASVDNTAIVWDIKKGQILAKLSESRQYVQGVTWDPLDQFVTSFSCDRSLRVHSVKNKFKCLHTVSKLSQGGGGCRQYRMWADESLSSFFRRHTFTPDGSLLIVPAGRFESQLDGKGDNCTYVFTRNDFTKPVLQLPSPEKPTVVVRCCPVLFELRPSSEENSKSPQIFSLPYRIVYAVASLDSVLLYDTQHRIPFAYVSAVHYASITDLAWSNDGLTLVVTSSDGYCSIVTFDPNELGIPLSENELPPVMSTPREEQHRDSASPTQSGPFQSPSPELAVPKPSQVETTPGPRGKPRRIRPTIISSFASSPGSSSGEQRQSEGREMKSPVLESPLVLSSSLSEERNSGTEPVSVALRKEDQSAVDSSDKTVDLTKGSALCSGGAASALPQQASTNSSKQPRRINFVTLSSSSSSVDVPDCESAARDSPTALLKMPETGQSANNGHTFVGGSAATKVDQNDAQLLSEEPMEVHIIE